uniref:Uncharacterized protein LOC114324722 n=1 Tax=Diabrotica virgifera virgifera TaxID=50390 RepID=A0A6P7EYN6_DIAVI
MSLLLYRSFIRSILDYGSFLYSQAASSNLKKIDNLVNKCLRLSIGAFKSTPVTNIYVECCEMPLELRRKYLCNKFLWKILSKNSSLVSKLHNLFIMDLTNKYWKKKESLILCESYKDCLEYKDTMYRNEMLPIYQTNLTDVPELEIRFLRDYSMYPNSLRNMMFNSDIENYFKNHHIVFTDASKKDDKTSCAFWDPIENYFEAKKLPSEFSSYSAEQIGILETLKYIKNSLFSKQNFLIISDCKSILDKLKNISTNCNINYLLLNILVNFKNLHEEGKIVKFVWVKAHCGIIHNEKVDMLAKEALDSDNFVKYSFIPEDLYSISKNIIRQ